METLTIFVIAVGLAMDAFAVSVASGIRLGCDLRMHHTFRLAFFFGFFQFMMTVLGWFAGASIQSFLQSLDHWIAFGLLAFIGGHMFVEALRSDDSGFQSGDPTRGLVLLGLSVATSIDAFAVGISLGVLHSDVWYPSIVIGLVAAGFTVAGMRLGCRIGISLSHRIEILGGIVLIGIGVKILLEHILKGI